MVADFVKEYNTVRLHSGTAYVTPQARLEGRDQRILAECRRKLAAARLTRKWRPTERQPRVDPNAPNRTNRHLPGPLWLR